MAGPEDVAGLSIRESAGSKAGRAFIAANGDRIDNLGEVPVKLKEKGGTTFGSVFQVAEVTRPLYSVGRICDNGCEVTFNSQRAKVCRNGKTVTTFERRGGLYLGDFELLPPDDTDGGTKATDGGTKKPFTRQGANQ